mmetsp:Transcript_42272/g.70559  ORF Transcript_42272/g.70559 Transcript_42272/m.70559 type:complete len:235 (-) Transcript_42272:340-1044(-)
MLLTSGGNGVPNPAHNRAGLRSDRFEVKLRSAECRTTSFKNEMQQNHAMFSRTLGHCGGKQVLLTSRQRANRHKGESLSQHVPQCSLQVSTKGRVMVYVVKTPLEGLEGVGKLLGGLYPRPLEHAVVVLHCQERNMYKALDFLPEDPKDPQTALRLVTGRDVPGMLRERELAKLPRASCLFIGTALSTDAMEEATIFHNQWDTRLKLCTNDCRTHTNALILKLTGKENACGSFF